MADNRGTTDVQIAPAVLAAVTAATSPHITTPWAAFSRLAPR